MAIYKNDVKFSWKAMFSDCLFKTVNSTLRYLCNITFHVLVLRLGLYNRILYILLCSITVQLDYTVLFPRNIRTHDIVNFYLYFRIQRNCSKTLLTFKLAGVQ